jgi:hypothetical protein
MFFRKIEQGQALLVWSAFSSDADCRVSLVAGQTVRWRSVRQAMP